MDGQVKMKVLGDKIWVGKIVRCKCGERIQLEQGDKVKYEPERRIPPSEYTETQIIAPHYSCNCPTCGRKVAIRN